MSTSPQPLDYPSRAGWLRRRGAYRAVMLLAALVAVLAAISACRRIRPIIDHNLAMADLHQQAMAYTILPGHLAYEERWSGAGFGVWNNTQPAPWLPSEKTEFGALTLAPPFVARLAVNGSTLSNIVFSHGRRAPGKPARLVCVEVNPLRHRSNIYTLPGPDPKYAWILQVRVIRPASMLSQGREVWTHQWRHLDPGNLTDPPFGIQITGGQIDPEDESHFTIGFNDRIIDGWLQPDDTVRMGLRLEIE